MLIAEGYRQSWIVTRYKPVQAKILSFEKRVNTLHYIAHMHFDFTIPKGLEITPSDEKKLKRAKKTDKKKWRQKYWHSF